MSGLSPSSIEVLAAAARRAGGRWPRIVIAATAVYVHRLTGARDVGFPVTARQGWVLNQTPGMVSNVLPLRLSLRADMTLGGEWVCAVGTLASPRLRQT